MKYFFLTLLFIVFVSCSNPLDKTYDKVSFAKDIIELNAIISEDELNELQEYIVLSSQFGVNLIGKTYNELLGDIETSKNNEIANERINIQELLNERLENHMCNDFVLEMNKKGIHQHNEQKNDSIIWDEDNYYIDY